MLIPLPFRVEVTLTLAQTGIDWARCSDDPFFMPYELKQIKKCRPPSVSADAGTRD